MLHHFRVAATYVALRELALMIQHVWSTIKILSCFGFVAELANVPAENSAPSTSPCLLASCPEPSFQLVYQDNER